MKRLLARLEAGTRGQPLGAAQERAGKNGGRRESYTEGNVLFHSSLEETRMRHVLNHDRRHFVLVWWPGLTSPTDGQKRGRPSSLSLIRD